MTAIFTVIMEESVPSRAKLFLTLVLFNPTMENTLSASAFECGSVITSLATLDSLSNLLIPVTFENINQGGLITLLNYFPVIKFIKWMCMSMYVKGCRIFLTLFFSDDILSQKASVSNVVGSWGIGMSSSWYSRNSSLSSSCSCGPWYGSSSTNLKDTTMCTELIKIQWEKVSFRCYHHDSICETLTFQQNIRHLPLCTLSSTGHQQIWLVLRESLSGIVSPWHIPQPELEMPVLPAGTSLLAVV